MTVTTTGLQTAFAALKRDLMAPEGPRISTMRNYRFALLPYPPEHEFEVRRQVAALNSDLRRAGWEVLDVSMQRLFLQRIRSRLGTAAIESLVSSEKRLASKDPLRPLARLQGPLTHLLEGPDGLAGDIIAAIETFVESHPDRTATTLVWISRLGALYPFVRTSSLLKHLDGRTRQLPVVLLYPGRQTGMTALSFMDELEPDRDYRPRIYSAWSENP